MEYSNSFIKNTQPQKNMQKFDVMTIQNKKSKKKNKNSSII